MHDVRPQRIGQGRTQAGNSFGYFVKSPTKLAEVVEFISGKKHRVQPGFRFRQNDTIIVKRFVA